MLAGSTRARRLEVGSIESHRNAWRTGRRPAQSKRGGHAESPRAKGSGGFLEERRTMLQQCTSLMFKLRRSRRCGGCRVGECLPFRTRRLIVSGRSPSQP